MRRSGQSHNFTVSATVRDNVAVARVEFWLNDVLQTTLPASTSASYTAALAIRQPGVHRLRVLAYDKAGNEGEAAATITR